MQIASEIFREKFQFERKAFGISRKITEEQTNLVPAGGLFEFYSDGLAGIGDFYPLAVGLPAFGNDLYQSFAKRRIGNVSDAVAIGLNVELESFVFAEFALFGVFEVDAGIFDGGFGIAADDFDANTIGLRLGSRGRVAGRRILRPGGNPKERAEQKTED